MKKIILISLCSLFALSSTYSSEKNTEESMLGKLPSKNMDKIITEYSSYRRTTKTRNIDEINRIRKNYEMKLDQFEEISESLLILNNLKKNKKIEDVQKFISEKMINLKSRISGLSGEFSDKDYILLCKLAGNYRYIMNESNVIKFKKLFNCKENISNNKTDKTSEHANKKANLYKVISVYFINSLEKYKDDISKNAVSQIEKSVKCLDERSGKWKKKVNSNVELKYLLKNMEISQENKSKEKAVKVKK